MSRARHSTRGFTLIEIMVALIVLGVGIVGVGALQLASKRANAEAFQHATAAALAAELVERMRANPLQLGFYTGDGTGRTIGTTSLAAVDCSVSCTTGEIAAYDLYDWQQSFIGNSELNGATATGGLTLPTACIDGPAGGSGNYRVAIAWRGRQTLSDPSVDSCGAGTGNYDSDGVVNGRRRVVVIDTYIAVPS